MVNVKTPIKKCTDISCKEDAICLPDSNLPRVVIIGGGFAGLSLIEGLKNKNVQVVLIDKNNFHQFQPLLYQVATSGLEPDSIAFPLRKQISNYKNINFRLAEVNEIDTQNKTIQTNKGSLTYDFLILATGTTTNFFGMKNVETHSLGMKDIRDSLNIRHQMLQNLEQATITCKDNERDALTNFVIVGGGPAGVEMAGALAEFKKYILPKDYPEFPTSIMKIYLVEGSGKLISAMSEKASTKTLKYLRELGVEVLLNEIVTDYDGNIVTTKSGKQLLAKNLIWTAGVKGQVPNGIDQKHFVAGNRLKTNQYLQVDGLNNVFALGDLAAVITNETPKGHPQVAQPAIQQGKILAKNILNSINNKPLKPFTYKDKGSLATVGKRRAVADLGKLKFGGYFAWLLWSFVHLMSISGFRNKLLVGINWIVSYFSYEKSNRLIIRTFKKEQQQSINNNIIIKKTLTIILVLIGINLNAQTKKSVEGNVNNLPVKEYTLTLKHEKVNKAGKEVMGMTINGTIPGPILEFTEGEYAVIYVKNEMDVETSIHWHGLLLPNFYDGVPYLTTPPIEPGHTLKYEFAIKQSGTYWYHGHTMLQEQVGVFGSFVIHPKKEILEYDKELVLMLSDWTNEKPMSVLRNLKRGTEWYNYRKGTSTPLNQVIKRGAFKAQLNFWKQRMESADIADIYYPAFLINGEQTIEYPEFNPDEKVRLRIIDGGASTQFWITFGGGNPVLISSDGIDVEPVKKNKIFIAIAEAYDFIVTIPENGKIEFKITAQDGSGTASAFIGNGSVLKAPNVMKPDKIAMMKKMAKMDMKMGAHALKFRPKKDERFAMKKEYGMQMKGDMKDMKMDGSDTMNDMDMKGVNKEGTMNKMDMKKPKEMDKMDKTDKTKMKDSNKKKVMDMKKDTNSSMNMNTENNEKEPMKMGDMQYSYDYLKSPNKTNFDKNIPVKEILLNLTGNMQRYIWSMNGVPLSETDNIKIKGNQVTRITLNNLTMMHHPMHLHGHFFRVLNKNEDYSPLKHTVNIPPMQQVTIEFYGNEYGDWFFHCHILYHMMGGMARVFSYDTPRDKRMNEFPAKEIVAETDRYYKWGLLDATSSMVGLNLTSSNIRNQSRPK